MNNDKILSLLKLQLNYVKQLDALLNDEKQSLIDRDHQSITSLAAKKQELMSQLQDIDSNLSVHCEGLTLDDEQTAIKNEIQTLLLHCHKNNLSNGKAIDLSINSIDRLQRSLIQKRSNKSMTYNAKGRTRSSGSSSGYTSA